MVFNFELNSFNVIIFIETDYKNVNTKGLTGVKVWKYLLTDTEADANLQVPVWHHIISKEATEI